MIISVLKKPDGLIFKETLKNIDLKAQEKEFFSVYGVFQKSDFFSWCSSTFTTTPPSLFFFFNNKVILIQNEN